MTTELDTWTTVHVVWKNAPDRVTVVAIIPETIGQTEEDLEKQYPDPEYEIQTFHTIHPESIGLTVGETHAPGWDDQDLES